MKRSTIWAAAGALATAVVAAGLSAGAAQADPPTATSTPAPAPAAPTPGGPSTDSDVDPAETDTPISGDPLATASAAALAHIGGGAVTGTEVGDEEGFYEVEVTLPDGSQVDVHLDEGFTVLGSIADHEDGS